MKSVRFIVACLISSLLLSHSAYSGEARPIAGKLVIKFSENSLAGMQWAGAGRTGSIPLLKKIAGEHFSRAYIGDNVLKAIAKRLDASNPRRTSAYSVTQSLSRICIVEFTSPVEVSAIISKLQSDNQIEYAEPMYERSISEIPNDPLYGTQYFLPQIQIFDAWDELPVDFKKPLIAIVDTGVDYLHEDLAANIFINPGEDGNDAQGKSKRTNGIDDDGNGFTDDWHGWDFTAVGSSSTQDNDPLPGHKHGTHVAGLAGAVTNNKTGIASAGRFIDILPVKIGPSDPNVEAVYNSYEGIAYAAAMGAKIINCSWGGGGASEAEQEVTTAAMSLGSLIIAAAGNSGIEGGFYPAAYPGVLSVASVNWDDVKSSFSNYHRTVDISTPGDDIFSTVPGNKYENLSGTSMSSPITAGVAGLVAIKFPNYSALQIGEQLKATADNIDSKQISQYRGLLGTGRLNAFRAVTETNARSAIVTRVRIADENKDSIFEAGEELKLFITVHNVLAPVTNAQIEVTPVSEISPQFIQQTASVGNLSTNEIRDAATPIIFKIPSDIPYNYIFELSVLIRDDNGTISRQTIAVTVHPTYRTFAANNITATFNSEGNIGFNDFPENSQGEGFLYKGSDNLLYEGAFMAGISPERLSNSARNNDQTERDFSFHPVEVIKVLKPGTLAVEEGTITFTDDNNPLEDVGIRVHQNVYQFNEPGREDFIITSYDIINTSGADFQDFYAGIFFDWDIGPAGQYNQARISADEGFGYVLNTQDASLPWVGVQVLSHQPNFTAIDNDGGNGTSINIYDGFDRSEKWASLQGGRRQSGVSDVSFVISAGPLKIRRGDTTRVAFSLLAAHSFTGLRAAAQNALKTSSELGIDTVAFLPTPDATRITGLYPNPANNRDLITIVYSLSEESPVHLRVIDILGKEILNFDAESQVAADGLTVSFKSSELPQGQYFVQLVTSSGAHVVPFVVFE
ncbi:MAG: S8 family serine peptidase [Bacteroidota bacterium]